VKRGHVLVLALERDRVEAREGGFFGAAVQPGLAGAGE
jgi:hypothetical protein